MKKNLQELIDLLPNAAIKGKKDIADVTIKDVTHDSRKVVDGTLFVCLPGARTDGHDYVMQAYRQGAAAVLVEKDIPGIPQNLTVIKVENTREAMMVVAPHFFSYPSHTLRIIGITGTNGKTTCTYLIKEILEQAGFHVGVIGTIQNCIGAKVLPAQNTTPDVIELQRLLAEMVQSKVDYVVMEVSSHALTLNRVAGCEFDVGVFTNMTRDHLDFHGTFERYLEAKTKLFQMLGSGNQQKEGKAAVINIDDKAAAFISKHTECKIFTYGIEKNADLQAKDTNIQANGAAFEIIGSFGVMPLQLKITGLFNVYNVLAAVGAALAEGIDISVIKTALEGFQSVPGRFELVDAGQPFSVIVDYAHTPDGLENILKTARQIAKNRIIVVFGCGGDRDKTKRPIMGELAVQYGDVVIATSDNPRTEDPAGILDDIEAGIKKALTPGKLYEKIIDRHQAIERALYLAEAGDSVVIAGKGHENYQILKDRTISFDDKEVVRDILKEIK